MRCVRSAARSAPLRSWRVTAELSTLCARCIHTPAHCIHTPTHCIHTSTDRKRWRVAALSLFLTHTLITVTFLECCVCEKSLNFSFLGFIRNVELDVISKQIKKHESFIIIIIS